MFTFQIAVEAYPLIEKFFKTHVMSGKMNASCIDIFKRSVLFLHLFLILKFSHSLVFFMINF